MPHAREHIAAPNSTVASNRASKQSQGLDGSHHVTLDAVTLELQSAGWTGAAVITSTSPAVPPCGRAPYNHGGTRQEKHGWVVDK